jgi:hypothetical protein
MDGRGVMADRIRTPLPRTCDRCGATGVEILEEDDTNERMEGGGNPRTVGTSGQVGLKDGKPYCTACGQSYA